PRSVGAASGEGRLKPPRLTSAGPKATLASSPASEPRCGAPSCGGCTSLPARAVDATRTSASAESLRSMIDLAGYWQIGSQGSPAGLLVHCSVKMTCTSVTYGETWNGGRDGSFELKSIV